MRRLWLELLIVGVVGCRWTSVSQCTRPFLCGLRTCRWSLDCLFQTGFCSERTNQKLCPPPSSWLDAWLDPPFSTWRHFIAEWLLLSASFCIALFVTVVFVIRMQLSWPVVVCIDARIICCIYEETISVMAADHDSAADSQSVEYSKRRNFASYSSRRKIIIERFWLVENWNRKELNLLNLCATQHRTNYDNVVSYVHILLVP